MFSIFIGKGFSKMIAVKSFFSDSSRIQVSNFLHIIRERRVGGWWERWFLIKLKFKIKAIWQPTWHPRWYYYLHFNINVSYNNYFFHHLNNEDYFTTAYIWCDSYSISISVYEVWGIRAEIQVSKREFHTHIHLD